MRLCRYVKENQMQIGFYEETHVIDMALAFEQLLQSTPLENHEEEPTLLSFLPPDGSLAEQTRQLFSLLTCLSEEQRQPLLQPVDSVDLLVPIASPSKLMLLAGNYGKHIEEGGRDTAPEREETFPYVFMKPPLTTLTHPGSPVLIPEISPHHIDWELELGVIIGRQCKGVAESDALSHVAGYTVVNDISDRQFQPNSNRRERDKDRFFDWLHGKWHDTFCPMGPCVLSSDSLPDPQTLEMKLSVNNEIKQHASTADMIFPVSAVVAFVSSFVTLEPGDIISTGTPHGVGSATGTFLKSGDTLRAEIERIGILRNPVE